MSSIGLKTVQRRIRILLRKVARVLFTKNTVTFLCFLMLSALFWVMCHSNSRRALHVDVPIRYVDIPDNVLIHSDLPQTVSILIRDEGKVLIGQHFTGQNDTLKISLATLLNEKSPLTIDFRRYYDDFRKFLPKTSSIASTTPEILEIDFCQLESAVLPVRLSQPPLLEPVCVLSDSVVFSPKFVQVFAPQSLLDSMTFITIDLPNSQPLNQSAAFVCPLVGSDSLRFSASAIDVEIPVEMTTEKMFELPIEPTNFPAGVALRAFPATIRATFSVPVSQFAAISPADFSVSVDYADVQRATSFRVPVRVSTGNSHVRALRYEPLEVEFILEK